jgi:hypothetical protein
VIFPYDARQRPAGEFLRDKIIESKLYAINFSSLPGKQMLVPNSNVDGDEINMLWW